MEVSTKLQSGNLFECYGIRLRTRISYDMVSFTQDSPLKGRLLAPFVSLGTLIVSLIIRVTGIVEPILIGIPFDLYKTLTEKEKLDCFLNIFNRPLHVAHNLVNSLMLNGIADIVHIGRGIFTGFFKPGYTYSHFTHKEHNF